MIALGGCVGSGLLVASGAALRNGPASLLIAGSSFLHFVLYDAMFSRIIEYFPCVGILCSLFYKSLLIQVGVLPWVIIMHYFGLLSCHWSWLQVQ